MPFAAKAVSHRILAGDYPLAPSDYRASPTGRKTVLFSNSPPPCQLRHTALDGCAQHSHSKQYRQCPLLKTLPAHS
ncbi:unnamed protein product [Staurois parvus]|uniref:Uncharacterized protein n=1 Tax=Staurois parvus TaxID=386267 RepID=A0ABN9CQ44_9NEOB|nr:unnamed protein product [Staurois parvus]